jgi:hypothetical protein
MIISISGLIGSGKDTIADYLVNSHNFRRESWAGTLKDAVSVVFGWDRTLIEGKTHESRKWREEPDEWWTQRLGETITPRRILQEWGTDVCRNHFHDEIWIASLENKLRKTTDNVVISDSRFKNEIESVKRLGGITIRVNRGTDPEWVSDYLMTGPSIDFRRKHPSIHASEYSSIGLDYDYVIDNNSTVDSLFRSVNDLLQSHQVSK